MTCRGDRQEPRYTEVRVLHGTSLKTLPPGTDTLRAGSQLHDGGHPWASTRRVRRIHRSPARRPFLKRSSGLHTETWSGELTWPGSTLLQAERSGSQLQPDQGILALLLGSGHALDILSVRKCLFFFFPCLGIVNYCGQGRSWPPGQASPSPDLLDAASERGSHISST